MKSTTKLFLAAFGWAALTLPFVGLHAAPDAPNGKPRVLIAKLGRNGLNRLWLDASVENVNIDTDAESAVLNPDKFGFLLRGPEHRLPPGASATTRVNPLLPVIGFLGANTPGFNGAIIDVGEHVLYLKHL